MPERSERHFRWAATLGKGVVSLLMRTVRFHTDGEDRVIATRAAGTPVLYVFWHGSLLPLVYHHREQGIVVLVSEHSDGEYIARILERYGFDTARGSSTRGAVKGLKSLIRAGRSGKDLGVTPDGPKGPRFEFKPGALLAARATGVAVVAIGVGVSRAWELNSWDRFTVPKPLSAVHLHYSEPRVIPRDASQADMDRFVTDVSSELGRVHANARAAAGVEPSSPPS